MLSFKCYVKNAQDLHCKKFPAQSLNMYVGLKCISKLEKCTAMMDKQKHFVDAKELYKLAILEIMKLNFQEQRVSIICGHEKFLFFVIKIFWRTFLV